MEITKELLEQNRAGIKAQYDAAAALFNAGKALGIMEGQMALLNNLIAFQGQTEPAPKIADTGAEAGEGQ